MRQRQMYVGNSVPPDSQEPGIPRLTRALKTVRRIPSQLLLYIHLGHEGQI